MNPKQEKVIIFSGLLISVLSFFSFGLYHLAKFEVTDEHLWKYDRIPKYWQALKEKNWEATYINDKPGVTVALISGIGLLSEPDPKLNQYLPAKNDTESKLFERYNYQQSEITNFRFRLPILIFSTLSLLVFFYFILQAFNSYRVALFSTVLIATNPILLGISQIINPDSFFWIFGGLAMVAYLAYLNKRKKSFLLWCGLLTGFALLSKYTAFILFAFFIFSALGKTIFQKEGSALKTNWQTILKYILEIGVIFTIACLVFAIFLPATFIEPNYLFKGLSQFLNLKIILSFLGIILITAGILTWKKNIIGQITQVIAKQKNIILTTSLALLSTLLLISYLNVWTGQKISPVDNLRDLAYVNEPKEFNFKPLMDRKDGSIFNSPQLYLMEAYPFIFSLSPLLPLLIFFITFQSLKKQVSLKYYPILFAGAIFILFYLFSALLAKIVTNARYSIILYPLIAILGGIIIQEFLHFFNLKKFKHFIITASLIFILGITALWQNKPFYFSYTSSLLPASYTIHDSWGHGAYEAATYLNSLPGAENLVVYSNTETFCRFFKGQCLKSRKINLAVAQPDYLIITKRGVLKADNHFVLENNPQPQKNAQFYFKKMETDSVWQILLNNREDNFVKIVKFEK